jgi:hypothetical protein
MLAKHGMRLGLFTKVGMTEVKRTRKLRGYAHSHHDQAKKARAWRGSRP